MDAKTIDRILEEEKYLEFKNYRKEDESEYYTNLQNGIKKVRNQMKHLTPKKKKRKK